MGSNGDQQTETVEVSGIAFEVRIWEDPSGLRGQVFHGEEKIAGVQIFHNKDVSKLLEMARRDSAVHRAAERLAS